MIMPNINNFDYKLFFENIPHAYCITDLNLQIIDANKVFLKLFEVGTLNDLATNFKSLLVDETYLTNDFSVSKNDSDNYEFSSSLASGFKVDFLVDWQFSVDKINNQIYISGNAIEKNDEVTSSEKKIKGKVGGWEYNIETAELWWSEEVYNIHEEVLNKPIEVATAINYYYKDDTPIMLEFFSSLLERGIAYDEELRIVTAKGNIRWVRAIGKRVSKNGKPYKLQGNFLDIHRQKTAELELEQHQVLLQKILDSLPVGIFWKDKNSVYSGFNKNSIKFFKKPLDELLGKRDEDIIDDLSLLNKIKAQDEGILSSKKSYFETRTVKIGIEQDRIVDIQKLPLINKNDEVFGILGVFIDVTQMTNLVNSLKRKNNELQELLFAVSHGLKEPLKAINRFAQLLKKRYGSDLGKEGNQIVDHILREAHRQHLQFIGLARFLEVGNKEQKTNLVDLNDVIYEVIDKMSIESESIPDFEITLEDVPELTYYKYDLKIVFRELIANAIKFKRPDKKLKIRISVQEEKTAWRIIVSDNGKGFDIRLKDKVFIIFQKLDSKYYYDSVGIGLSICKKIIEYYGGEINIESAPFKGVALSFTVPKNILQEELTHY
jgi:signal transduction histidine kinase